MSKSLLSLILAAFSATAACAPDPADVLEESAQLAAPATPEPIENELTAYPNSTFFRVLRPDLRRCVYPLCGGFFTARVNQAMTTCSDGVAQPECRILEFDYSTLKLDAASQDKLRDSVEKGQALLRGAIRKTAPIAGKTYDKLVVLEAWTARALSTPSGTFVRTNELPLACPACATFQHGVLNRSTTAKTHSVVFDATRFSATLSAELLKAIQSQPEGVLTAGVSTTSGSRQTWNVSEAYTPFVASGPRLGKLGESCGSRGLPMDCESGLFCQRPDTALCGRADAPGTCQTKPSVCTTIYMPVCGCDGMTYSNRCVAYGSGVSVDYEGTCKAP